MIKRTFIICLMLCLGSSAIIADETTEGTNPPVVISDNQDVGGEQETEGATRRVESAGHGVPACAGCQGRRTGRVAHQAAGL